MPKQRPFACKHCDRIFSMAAHLTRHSRVHGAKRPTSKRSIAARPPKAPAARNGPFTSLVSSLHDSHRALIAERDRLSSQIAALELALSHQTLTARRAAT